MKHPFAGKALYFYVAIWIAVIIIHVAALHLYFGFDWDLALSDAVIHNCLIMGIGLSYWYVVQYISPSHQGTAGSIISQVVGILITSSIVSFGARAILKALYSGDGAYMAFLTDGFPWRIVQSTFALALVVVIYYLLKYTHNLKEREREELQLQDMLKHAELEMLKFQINPHFIFNSLNSISSLTIIDADKARDMVIKLSDFLRSSLGSKNVDKHTLEEELDQMNLYLEIEKVRFGERLLAVNEIDQKCLSMTLPNMILQPLYENAIKYGIYEQLDDVKVSTRCVCENRFLKISISNNYDSEAIVQKGKGIGLKNVSNRLELIYGISGLMTIEKNRTIFTVHLLIPQQTEDHDHSSSN
ncbi:signal transduction histidine kinase, LytS [Fulvivirga imtechensis AK7]|uniref:Signal transduction histidine kinase, LytS n=1 Tax=Fulvivirga imtechensis AK7 TaxID=1237149 RepID=L8JLP3_9BACT|nr:histidine kinase [Fulvivirga imtechensis]ELR69846.1 signal transduction histidine kinase, LytS [Fulvivirga imtechensis AK7]